MYVNFLKSVLMSEDQYWIVAQINEYHNVVDRGKRDKDSIILTCIPYGLTRGVKEDEILFSQMEKLRRSELLSIHINQAFAPFQQGITFYNIYDGYPIQGNVHQFLKQALVLKQ